MPPIFLQPWQWPIGIFGALLIGLSKTGVPGGGIFAVALFTLLYKPEEAIRATGVVLPLLIAADIIAVKSYHRHAVWSHLWRLFPWAAAGVVVGFFTMKYMESAALGRLIGVILVSMVGLHIWRKCILKDEEVPHGQLFAGTMGLSAGFTTIIANAAGPIMVVYLLAMQLPKLEFLGTGAWYYLILNSFKVPFQWQAGSMDAQSLWLDALLVPFVWIGAFGGRALLPRINQRWFENLSLFFAAVAGVKLIFF
jgi:uncharacterized membrane protein YfcA